MPSGNQAPVIGKNVLTRVPEQAPQKQTDFGGAIQTPTRKRRFQEFTDLTSIELEQNYPVHQSYHHNLHWLKVLTLQPLYEHLKLIHSFS